jgi:hypothetical protein
MYRSNSNISGERKMKRRAIATLVFIVLFLALVFPLNIGAHDNFRMVRAQPPLVLVTNVTSSKTVVGQGFSTVINIAIANNGMPPNPPVQLVAVGAFATDPNKTTYVNASQVAVFAGWVNATVPLEWNTTGYAYGNYTVGGTAVDAGGGGGVSSLTNGVVYIGIPGDINGDGPVNILDSIVLGNAFLATPSSSGWNSNADINDDNVVNILDSIIIGNHFLQHYP